MTTELTTPQPRTGSYLGAQIHNSLGLQNTWIEGEEFAYPNNTLTRRCYARCEDGKNRVVRCKVADTFFSIPAVGTIDGKQVKGFVSCTDGVFLFHAYGFGGMADR